jgi:hypothetical protein
VRRGSGEGLVRETPSHGGQRRQGRRHQCPVPRIGLSSPVQSLPRSVLVMCSRRDATSPPGCQSRPQHSLCHMRGQRVISRSSGLNQIVHRQIAFKTFYPATWRGRKDPAFIARPGGGIRRSRCSMPSRRTAFASASYRPQTMANGLAMVTCTWFSRSPSRCGSSGGEPITNCPAGITTNSGHSGQSLNRSPAPGCTQRFMSAPTSTSTLTALRSGGADRKQEHCPNKAEPQRAN